MIFFKKILPIIMTAVLFSSFVACGFSTAAEDIAYAALVTAIDGTVAALGVTGEIPPGDVAPITAVANAALTAADNSINEGRSSDTAVVKSGKIAGYWASVLDQIHGLSATDQSLLTILSASIKAYVAIVAPSNAVPAADGSFSFSAKGKTVVVPAKYKMAYATSLERKLHLSETRSKLEKSQR